MRIQRVGWIVLLALSVSAGAWGITIPITTTYSTGFSSTGTRLTTDKASDGNWTFYVGNDLSALSGTPLGAWVFTKKKKPPLQSGTWAANDTSSVWISPTASRVRGRLSPVSGTSYIAVTTFTIPAMTDPPNWTQWWLVMSGIVWADDSVAGNTFYLLDSGNAPVYTGSLSGSPTATASAGFQFQTWVNPGDTYKLAFILPNTPNTWAGFRLQFTEKYVTPEPGAWITMATVGVGLALAARRRRRSGQRPA